MTIRSIRECDRCGKIAGSHIDMHRRWTQIYAARVDGRDVVGTSATPADLCENCTQDLRSFVFASKQPDEAQ